MGWASAVLFAALVVLAGAYVLYLYRRREVGVPGVGPLAALRIATLAVVALLLLDPTLPAVATGSGRGDVWTLVDGSRSMEAPGGEASPWNEALRGTGARDGGTVLVFGGDDPRTLGAGDSVGRPPFETSRLVPALERAAESGARSVRVASDLRIEDAGRARDVAERFGLDVTVDDLGSDVRSAGVASLRFDGPLEADEPASAEATFFAVGASAADSVTLEVREEGRTVVSRRLPVPDEGRLHRVDLDLPPPEGEGEVRYTARVVLDGDRFPDDDQRVAWADVSPEEGNLVLVSLEPDWELRFLVPVFRRVTGLPARGFVRVGPDRYLAMDPAGAGETVDRAEVEVVATGAEMLVVQASGAPPAWLADAFSSVRRGAMLARGPGAAAAAGVTVGTPREGEWYVSPDVPPSPLAAELAGADVAGLPPLGGVLPLASDEPAGPVALDLRLRGSGPGEAALVLLPAGDGGRRVVALASGFWRWAFREGADRDAYQRLWSGVAGWLLADEPLVRGPGVRPEVRTVPWREPVWWTASGMGDTDVRVRLSRDDTVALDTVVTVPQAGRFRLPPMEPGTWSWRTEAVADSLAPEGWEGRLDVESWTSDLRHPRDTLLAASGGQGGATPAAGTGRPLRTHPLPYLLVLVLLSVEWIGRRRKGLR